MNNQTLYTFDEFEIDPVRRQICRSGVVVPVPQKAFQLLLYLVENPGRVLLKAEIMKAVWPQASVEESNLTQSIFLLRKALGEQSGRNRYIVTVAGEGYQFAVYPQQISKALVDAPGFPENTPHEMAMATASATSREGPLASEENPSHHTNLLKERSVGLRRKATLLGIAAAILLAGFSFWLWHRGKTPQLAGNGSLVLAEFANSTGDPAFSAALRQGLAAQLEQSPYLGLISDSRIAQTMKMMAQAKDAPLTPVLAREVCERTGSAAVIEGSIASLGRQYVLGIKAQNCKNGETLAEDQETADTKEQVLQALGTASGKLRGKLGESLPSLERYDAPPADVTTASLEALEAYGLGFQAQSEGDCVTSVAFYKQAIAIDPGFAMAYAHLGICTPGDEGINATRKAYTLLDHVSQREKFYLASHYEQYATENLAAARKILETWAATYPHDGDPSPNLLKLYLTTGEYEQALPLVQSIVRNSPGTPAINASRLATTLLYLNRVDEAKTVLLDAEAHHNDVPVQHYFLYEVYFLQNDSAAMAREASYLHSQKNWLGNTLELESMSAAYFGKFTLARSLNEQASQDALREQDSEGAAGTLAEAALQEALAGDATVAVKKSRASLTQSKTASAEILAGMAEAIAGDQTDAAAIEEDLNRRFSTNTLAQVAVATMRASLLLGNGKSPEQAQHALEAIAPAAPYAMSGQLFLVPVYVRGQAHLAAGQNAEAEADFQLILDHPGVTRNFVTGSIAHVGLARAQEQAGDHANARKSCEEFRRLWRDADSNLPLMKVEMKSSTGLTR